MSADKLGLLGGVLLTMLTGRASPPGGHPASVPASRYAAPAAPVVDPLDQAYLTRFVRETIRQQLDGRGRYRPAYIPPALRDLTCRAVVRLRRHGYLWARGWSQRTNVLDACAEAAIRALQDLRTRSLPYEFDRPAPKRKRRPTSSPGPDRINVMNVEIELIGPSQTIARRPGQPGSMLYEIEPGVDGLGVRLGKQERWFCPSELIAQGLAASPADARRALERLAARLEVPAHRLGSALKNLTFFRFRTCFWYEPEPGATPVELVRGVVPLAAEVVAPGPLDAAIERMGRYLLYRRNSDNLFSYEYDPTADHYSARFNWVRQAGATWALVLYARWSQDRQALQAAAACIDRLRAMLAPLEPSTAPAAFVAAPDKRNKLGVTALLLLCLADYPDRQRYADDRRRLVEAILSAQRADGSLRTAFPPALPVAWQDHHPGEALLALARVHALQPDRRILEAFERAFGYYRAHFHSRPVPAFVAWQSQAFALMARLTHRADYADFVFEMTDWLGSFQRTASDCPWPELIGGVRPRTSGQPGCATAAYLEGFVEAYRLARDEADPARAQRYETLVRRAARFVMQLQFRPEEAYYVRSPQDAIGGVRRSLTDPRLRIDNTQHALVALMKVRQALFER